MSMNCDKDNSLQHEKLAAFILEKEFGHGAKIGADSGKCMAVVLEHNPQLRFIGMDMWDGEHGVDFERECRERCAPYKERVLLLKGDAATIAKGFASKIFDFAFYGYALDRKGELDYHEKVLKLWMHKIKSGGYLIGQELDKGDMKTVLAKLGYENIAPLEVLDNTHTGLHYIRLN
ncbi:MAG: hypothetical protein R2800_15550 [Flavipsychrobacter sp.]